MVPLGWHRVLLWLMIGMDVCGAAYGQPPAPSLYSLSDAIDHGVVDINFNPKSKRPIGPLLYHLPELDPGIVNRFGFRYGGPDTDFIAEQGALLRRIRAMLPHALMGAVFPQDVFANYNITLECPELGRHTFTADTMKSVDAPGHVVHFVMLDMGKRSTQEFETCLGKIFIDQGFTFLRFEGMGGVYAHAPSRTATIAGYQGIQEAIRRYADARSLHLYFSGYPGFARDFHFDALYEPARFFHVTVESWVKYQNRIVRPGVGKGYTYALSPNIIRDRIAEVPPYTHVMFDVDNWDAAQDDLRRLMELDAINRRAMLLQSAENAASQGAYFIPALNHCDGCVSPRDVGDPCEILPDGSSQYDAYACGDWPTILRTLVIQSRGRKHQNEVGR